MAIKVNGHTVVHNSRKGSFETANPGVYTTTERDALSPETGDIIYNSEEENLEVFNGIEWVTSGSGQVEPDKLKPGENDFAEPPYGGGTGTINDPYIITSGPCNRAGKIYSDQKITFFGLEPGTTLHIEENGTNNNGKADQEPIVVPNTGLVQTTLEFQDVYDPANPEGYTTSATLNEGDIYWKWDITVLDDGLAGPSITKLMGTDSVFVDPITSDDGFTPKAGSVASVVFQDSADAVLTPGNYANIPAIGGSGSGLEITINTNNAGEVISVTPVAGIDSGYKFEEIVTADLSAAGGNSDTKLILLTQPIILQAATTQVTNYVKYGDPGDFRKMEWQFDSSGDFNSPFVYELLDQTTTPSVSTNFQKGTIFYARFRYYSVNNVVSSWSNTIKTATADAFTLSYVLPNQNRYYNGTQYKSFESTDINLEPISHTYFTYIPGAWGLRTGQGKGSGAGGAYGSAGNGQAIWIQVRQPLEIEVTEIGASGQVLLYNHVNSPIGLPAHFDGTDKPVIFMGGSGTGFQARVEKQGGITRVRDIPQTGNNYEVGDILTFYPPLGNGGDGGCPDCTTINAGYTSVNVDHTSGTMDLDNDMWVHLIGGSGGGGGSAHARGGGGGGAGSWQGTGQRGSDGASDISNAWGGPGGAGAPEDPSIVYPSPVVGPVNGENGHHRRGAGGGGGYGWGGPASNGSEGGASGEHKGGGGGGGGGGSRVNSTFIADITKCVSADTFSNGNPKLLINGQPAVESNGFHYRVF